MEKHSMFHLLPGHVRGRKKLYCTLHQSYKNACAPFVTSVHAADDAWYWPECVLHAQWVTLHNIMELSFSGKYGLLMANECETKFYAICMKTLQKRRSMSVF